MNPIIQLKTLLVACVTGICLPVAALAAGSTSGSVTTPATVGGAMINLAVPRGHCAMSRDLASDSRLIGLIEKGSGNTIEVILAFAHCEQLEAWRTGQRQVLDDFGQYQTLVSTKERNFKGSEAALIKQVCDQQRNNGDAIIKQTLSKVNSYLESASKVMKMNELKLLGILSESQQNCSVTFVQKMTTEFGNPKTQFGINTTTILNGKVVYLNIYTRHDGEDSLTEIQEIHDKALETLLEAN